MEGVPRPPRKVPHRRFLLVSCPSVSQAPLPVSENSFTASLQQDASGAFGFQCSTSATASVFGPGAFDVIVQEDEFADLLAQDEYCFECDTDVYLLMCRPCRFCRQCYY